jgi:hypothetical protein
MLDGAERPGGLTGAEVPGAAMAIAYPAVRAGAVAVGTSGHHD